MYSSLLSIERSRDDLTARRLYFPSAVRNDQLYLRNLSLLRFFQIHSLASGGSLGSQARLLTKTLLTPFQSAVEYIEDAHGSPFCFPKRVACTECYIRPPILSLATDHQAKSSINELLRKYFLSSQSTYGSGVPRISGATSPSLLPMAMRLISLVCRLGRALPIVTASIFLNLPLLFAVFCGVFCELMREPKPCRKEEIAVRLRRGCMVGRQHAIRATFVSTNVQKRPWDVMPRMS